ACALLVGDAHASARAPGGPLPHVLGSRSRVFPGTRDALGWQVGEGGFRIVLAAGLPEVIAEHLADEVARLLETHGLDVVDIGSWVVHAGGPKVLDAVERALDLPADALWASRDSLAEVGNLSSASVLHVLHTTAARRPPAPGTLGVLLAFGPGVSCDLVLLRWPAEG
ncbi:MAG TPA: 3-oxoacyl-[acyl-carrier-protein] synthase III C-terminal domain-containing protein, partial [Actinotalea sp.]|nr:3-oxoacyl-[acyl-carrier-protein] synthase III C-terminal domain-containing protein [Actinotalea sp.]